jgi:HEAT repeat protein
MKKLLIIIIGLVLVGGCSSEPMYEGYPLHHWREQLKKNDYMARWRACGAFGRFGPQGKDAIPDIIACLHDEHHLVRQEASNALARMGPDAKPAVPDLVALLKDPITQVRQAASAALEHIDYPTWYEATRAHRAEDE